MDRLILACATFESAASVLGRRRESVQLGNFFRGQIRRKPESLPIRMWKILLSSRRLPPKPCGHTAPPANNKENGEAGHSNHRAFHAPR